MLDGSILDGIYVKERTERQDKRWTSIYGAMMMLCAFGGTHVAVRRSPVYRLANEHYLNDLNNCPVDAGPRRQLLGDETDEEAFAEFLHVAGSWLALSAAGSVVAGVAMVQLFRKYSNAVVKSTVALQVLLYTTSSIAYFAMRAYVPGTIFLAVAALIVVLVYHIRSRLELVAQLLSVAANGLHSNPSLLLVAVALVGVTFVVTVPMIFLIATALSNGQVVTNTFTRNEGGSCWAYNETNQEEIVPCCLWQTDTFASAYIVLVTLATLWTAFLCAQIRSYVIAGSITQWYFGTNGEFESSTRGTTIRALRHAMTTSLGSLCCSSAVLLAVAIIRSALRSLRTNRRLAIIYCMLATWIDYLYALLEVFTKFATVQMAITGEPFMEASRSVTGLLFRNSLSAVSVWWLPPLVLNSCAFVISLAWGVLIGFISAESLSSKTAKSTEDGIFIGSITGIMCMFVLSYFGGLLIQTTNAVFVCYAWDNESNQVTHQNIHDIFKAVPTGTLIVQPDENLAYGAVDGQETGAAETEQALFDTTYEPSDLKGSSTVSKV